jgi:hypothetical protein
MACVAAAHATWIRRRRSRNRLLPPFKRRRGAWGEGVRFDYGQASYVAKQIGDSVETTLRTYTHLFDEAEHAEQSRGVMDDSFGLWQNTWQTSGSESPEKPQKATVTELAAVQGKTLEARRQTETL